MGLPFWSIRLNGPPIAETAGPVPAFWPTKRTTPKKSTRPERKAEGIRRMGDARAVINRSKEKSPTSAYHFEEYCCPIMGPQPQRTCYNEPGCGGKQHQGPRQFGRGSERRHSKLHMELLF